MTSTESTISAPFDVTSGALCFGSLHDILEGAAAPIPTGPSPHPRRDGTAEDQPMVHNVRAKTGTWEAYALLDIKNFTVQGWFAAHAEVDPVKEIAKILHVAGSPFDYEPISTMNTDKTRKEGVFVINVDDWGMARGEDEFPNEVQEGDADNLVKWNSVGLVDHSHAASYVQEWIKQKPSQRGASPNGMWMYIPRAVRMFGRFGFNEEYTHARSFLFFVAQTNFFRTCFPWQENPIRRRETELERLRRGLLEGKDYSGIEELRMSNDNGLVGENVPVQPPDSQQLGPYAPSEHIMKAKDIEALRVYQISKADYERNLRLSQPPLSKQAPAPG